MSKPVETSETAVLQQLVVGWLLQDLLDDRLFQGIFWTVLFFPQLLSFVALHTVIKSFGFSVTCVHVVSVRTKQNKEPDHTFIWFSCHMLPYFWDEIIFFRNRAS